MYVCLCKGITDTQIREAAASGCTTLRDLRSELGVGSQCAKCVRQAREIMRDTHSDLAASRVAELMPVMFSPRTA